MSGCRRLVGRSQGRRPRRRFLAAGVGAATLGLIPPVFPPPPQNPPPPPQQNPGPRGPLVAMGTTADGSELVHSLPVRTRGGRAKRVVMSLGPPDIPSIRPGDHVMVNGEVEVSTTCVERSVRCVGRPYHYNPTISARLVLARHGHTMGGSNAVPISGRRSIHCKQQRPNRNHHCVIAFGGSAFNVPRHHRHHWPCGGYRCRVNLVMSAHHPKARSGHRVVVGVDRPHGRVAQDRGRLNLLRIRHPAGGHGSASSASARANKPLKGSLPVARPGADLKKQVVYSVQVPSLRKGEKLAVSGKLRTGIGELRNSVLITSGLILAGRPTATRPSAAGRRFGFPHGEISETNGFNCTQGPSAFRTPCLTRKVGLLRVKRDAVDSDGHPLTLYVNFVAATGATLKNPRGGHTAHVRGGALKVTRYGPG